MLKKLAVALNLIPKRIIVLLMIAGLTYLIYPRITFSAASWLPSSNSLQKGKTVNSQPFDASPPLGGNEGGLSAKTEIAAVTLTGTPPPQPSRTATAMAANTNPPTSQVEETPFNPTPANQATADYLEALATAEARFNSTATPPSQQTLTPVPPTATATASPRSMAIVIVTPTSTPKNIITAAAQAARATAVATAVGTYTPVPFNWVLPIVVTVPPATAIPANAATTTFQAAEATAAAFVNGTPTPAPVNLWTATPTPFMRPVIGEVATPYLNPTPTPTPLSIPTELVGKIIFLSNRSGGPNPLPTPLVYAIDPDGSNLAVLTDDTFYKTALVRDTYSADQQYRAFVRTIDGTPAIFSYDYQDKSVKPITLFPPGQGAWDPVWSPTQDQIAFVSNADVPDDEIWITNRDSSGLQRLTELNAAYNGREIGKNTFLPEVNGHPSWSPDGSQLVFWSNRNRRREIFVMNADGSNVHSLSTTIHDDWNPIWIKYTDPPRGPVLGIGAE